MKKILIYGVCGFLGIFMIIIVFLLIDVKQQHQALIEISSPIPKVEGFSKAKLVEAAKEHCREEYREEYEIICEEEDEECLMEQFELELSEEDLALCLDSYYRGISMQSADRKEKIGACELISNIFERRNCLDSVYIDIAFNERDPEACKQRSDESQHQPCINEVYYYLAGDNKESDKNKAQGYCEKISSDSLKNLCLERFVN